MFVLYLFLIYFSLRTTYGNPMLCTEITATNSITEFSDTFINVTASAKIEILSTHSSQNHYIRVSNVMGKDFTNNVLIDTICYAYFNSYQCTHNISNSNDFLLSDPDVRILGIFRNNEVTIFGGYINNGSISNSDGTFLTQEKPCFNYYSDKPDVNYTSTSCCTKFIPAPIAPSNAARCKKFRSRVNLLNDDYTIYATTSMNYTLQGNQIIAQGDYSVSEYSKLEYLFDHAGYCDSSNSGLKCNINLPYGDSKTFISVYFVSNKQRSFVPRVGSFIIRNNQTLMYEGVPFTPTNDCMYFSDKKAYADDKNKNSEFCCKEFE